MNSDYNTLTEMFKDIADAIREKEESSEEIAAEDFAERIRALNVIKDYELYAFHVNQTTESDPFLMVTYPEGCDNFNWIPAKMNFDTNEFEYNEWENSFFIKNLKVVMLSQDGHELYEIDPTDYTKKKDNDEIVGEEGNVMVAFPKVYFKTVLDENGKDFTVYISNKQLNEQYKCYAHLDAEGNELDYCYIGAYEGSKKNNILRCLSNQTPLVSATATDEIAYATINGNGWYTGLLVDYQMINMLLTLISRNTNQQAVFGAGRSANSNSKAINTGTMDQEGLFWGDTAGVNGVKVFGIENFYGNIFKRIGGWMCLGGQQVIKLTYGTEDGSTIVGYNTTGEGYIPVGEKLTRSTKSGYIKEMLANEYGLFPVISSVNSGSQTTYWCDYASFNNSTAVGYAYGSGFWVNDGMVGGFYVSLDQAPSISLGALGASLSFKKKVS